jgi:hypothetical protein
MEYLYPGQVVLFSDLLSHPKQPFFLGEMVYYIYSEIKEKSVAEVLKFLRGYQKDLIGIEYYIDEKSHCFNEPPSEGCDLQFLSLLSLDNVHIHLLQEILDDFRDDGENILKLWFSSVFHNLDIDENQKRIAEHLYLCLLQESVECNKEVVSFGSFGSCLSPEDIPTWNYFATVPLPHFAALFAKKRQISSDDVLTFYNNLAWLSSEDLAQFLIYFQVEISCRIILDFGLVHLFQEQKQKEGFSTGILINFILQQIESKCDFRHSPRRAQLFDACIDFLLSLNLFEIDPYYKEKATKLLPTHSGLDGPREQKLAELFGLKEEFENYLVSCFYPELTLEYLGHKSSCFSLVEKVKLLVRIVGNQGEKQQQFLDMSEGKFSFLLVDVFQKLKEKEKTEEKKNEKEKEVKSTIEEIRKSFKRPTHWWKTAKQRLQDYDKINYCIHYCNLIKKELQPLSIAELNPLFFKVSLLAGVQNDWRLLDLVLAEISPNIEEKLDSSRLFETACYFESFPMFRSWWPWIKATNPFWIVGNLLQKLRYDATNCLWLAMLSFVIDKSSFLVSYLRSLNEVTRKEEIQFLRGLDIDQILVEKELRQIPTCWAPQ